MKKFFMNLVLVSFVAMGLSPFSFAGKGEGKAGGKECVVPYCGTEVKNADTKCDPDGHECKNGHAICKDCLTEQVHTANTFVDRENLKKQGLPCAQKGCEELIPLEQIKTILDPVEREALESR